MQSRQGELGGDSFRRERNLAPFGLAWTLGHADAEANATKTAPRTFNRPIAHGNATKTAPRAFNRPIAHGVEEIPAFFGLDEAADIVQP
jgi:hypothetical protein